MTPVTVAAHEDSEVLPQAEMPPRVEALTTQTEPLRVCDTHRFPRVSTTV